MKTAEHKVAMSSCIACNYAMDGALGIGSEDSPAPGDLTICLRCGHLMSYSDELKLRELTDKEAYEAAGDKLVLAAQKARGKALAQTPPDERWVKDFCQPNTAACCRYLTMAPTGWSCEKHNPPLHACSIAGSSVVRSEQLGIIVQGEPADD